MTSYNHATRLDILGTRMKELHSNTCTASRPNASNITITNYTPEKVDSNQLALYGIVLVKEEALDIVFDASDLSPWSPAVPQEGDSFLIGSKTYKVFSHGPPPDGEVYRYTTTSKSRIRVHLKG